ncbi:MAG TPA: radical SAM protein [Candidatus Hydrogenedentes bacterium]|nr:radical SAM protein [Candidatus Hydrogenedentota bacterium]
MTIRNLDDAYFASQDFVLETTAKMIDVIRSNSKAPIILGGVGYSIAPRAVLAYTRADYGIVGEGEDALPDLLDCLVAGETPTNVPGAVFRNDGEIVDCAPAFPDFPSRPTPPRRFLDNRRYFAEGGQAGIETKRGCDQHCIYCVEPTAKGNRTRLRAPESVADEYADLLDQGIDVIHLCDSEFNQPHDHARACCETLIARGIAPHIRWYTYASPHPFDADLAQLMRLAGCVGINFGVDHADYAMLKRLGRNYTPDAIHTAVQACRDAGIAVMLDMLLGAPGETRETLARAIHLISAIAPDRAGLSCGVRIYPNTPLAQMVRRQGPLADNPALHGAVTNNDDMLRPIFYVDPALDGDIHTIVSEYVGDNPLFFHTDPNQVDGNYNYNYNDNSELVNAIRDGERGAYWDILRRLADT